MLETPGYKYGVAYHAICARNTAYDLANMYDQHQRLSLSRDSFLIRMDVGLGERREQGIFPISRRGDLFQVGSRQIYLEYSKRMHAKGQYRLL